MTRQHSPSPGALSWIVAATSFGFVVVQLDVTIVNVALPRIGAELGAGVAELQWVVDAYTLAFAVLLLSAGVLGDRYGSKRTFLIGFAVFAAASLACGLAVDAAGLIAARAVQGIGAALLLPSSLALLNYACADDEALRARSVGFWTAAGGVAIATGPIAGGLLLAGFGWRSIFLINIPVCGLGAVLTFRHVPETRAAGEKRGLDLSGQTLAILALTGLTGAAIEARPLGPLHPVVLGAVAAAAIGGCAFVWAEARAKAPMLPLRFFALPNFSPAVVFGVLVNLTYYGMIFVLSLYLQQVHGYSAIQAGLAYLPLTGTFIISNVVSGWISGRMGSRVPMAIGALVGAGGFALLLGLGEASSYPDMLPAFVLIPCGMGLAVPAMTTAILSSVEREWSATASAVLNAARQAGGGLGVAAFGALVGHGSDQIVSGLGAASLGSAALLIAAAALAWIAIRRTEGGARRRPHECRSAAISAGTRAS